MNFDDNSIYVKIYLRNPSRKLWFRCSTLVYIDARALCALQMNVISSPPDSEERTPLIEFYSYLPIPHHIAAKVRTPRYRFGAHRVLPPRASGRAPELGDCAANHNGPGQCHGLDPVNLSLRAGPGSTRSLRIAAQFGQGADREKIGRFVGEHFKGDDVHAYICVVSELCLNELNALEKYSLIVKNAKDQGDDSGMMVSATLYGRLMAQYCLNFRTVKLLRKVSGDDRDLI